MICISVLLYKFRAENIDDKDMLAKLNRYAWCFICFEFIVSTTLFVIFLVITRFSSIEVCAVFRDLYHPSTMPVEKNSSNPKKQVGNFMILDVFLILILSCS